MKNMMMFLTVTAVMVSQAFCIMGAAQDTIITTNTAKSAGIEASTSGMTAHAESVKTAIPANAKWVEQVTNLITVTGTVTRNKATMVNMEGKTVLPLYYVLTEVDGTTVVLSNNKPKAGTPVPAIKPANYLDKVVTVAGNGYNTVDHDGRKQLVIYSISKIDEITAAPAGTNTADSAAASTNIAQR